MDRVVRRGAISNVPNRYSSIQREALDDDPNPPKRLKTRVEIESIGKILTTNNSPDLDFDRTINPYRGCEHGCVYCYARPTHAYYDLSPGLDFESRIFARVGAPEALRKEMNLKNFRPARTILGAVTDCYQPAERKLQITRKLLQVFDDFQHPIAITTRSDLILRDLDLLVPLARNNLVSVAVTVTTLNEPLRRTLEPGAPSGIRRLHAVRLLTEAGIPTSVFVAPIIPGLTDHEMEEILHLSREAGAMGAHGILLRLPREVAPLFEEWLSVHEPESRERVLHLIRSMRGGKLYDSRFGHRMEGTGIQADLLFKRFHLTRKKLGLDRPLPDLNFGRFRRKADGKQPELFGGDLL